MKLRPYQRAAVDRCHELWASGTRSVLVQLATGTGKTVTAAQALLDRRNRGRALWLVHREELLQQGADALRGMGLSVEIERARERALVLSLAPSDVVVASVPTLRGRRLERWPRDSFATIVADECHHSTADSWRAVLDRFDQAAILGLTATPDRTDGTALAHVFDAVAARYLIRTGISDGYLVPIRAQVLPDPELDLDAVRTAYGDYVAEDLAKHFRRRYKVYAAAIAQASKERPTVVFAPTVDVAEGLAAALDAHAPAVVVTAKTPTEERRALRTRFESGDVKYVCNFGVLTEGWDAPPAACVAMLRPTKSRSLYAQMCGRGTRPLRGLVDGLATAEERRAAIASSAKPDLLLLDFTGRTKRVDLIGPEDVLGDPELDPLPDEVKRMAREALEGGEPKSLEELLDLAAQHAEEHQARIEKDARMDRVKAIAKYTTAPLEVLGGSADAHLEAIEAAATAIRDTRKRGCVRCKGTGKKGGRGPESCGVCKGRGRVKGTMDADAHPPTAAIVRELDAHGVRLPATALQRQAEAALAALKARGLCTLRQAEVLRRAGLPSDVAPRTASTLIDGLKRNHGTTPAMIQWAEDRRLRTDNAAE